MISTGKSEIMGNIYFIAANHFMGNILDEENDNNNDDDDAIDINASTNTPQQRKKRSIQRHNKGFLRLDAIAKTLQRKELMHATAHFYLPESKRDSKLVINSLKSKAKNIKQQKELDNVSGLMEFHGQDKLNAKILRPFERIVPEIFDGWLKYQGVITKKNREDGVLKSEFEKRGLGNEHDDNNIKITQLKTLLKTNERTRLTDLVKKELIDNNIPQTNASDKERLKLLKTHWLACDNDNVNCSFDWNHFNVDLTKFFMAQDINLFQLQVNKSN